MFRMYPNEKFKEFFMPVERQKRYAVSNKGRIVSFTEKVEDGDLLRGCDTSGYRALRYTEKVKGKMISRPMFIYKLVGETFLTKPSEEHHYLIHLDFKKDNDDVANLRWVTREEALAHRKNSPNVKRAKLERLERNTKADGWKLTATKVILIKKLLSNPHRKTRLKILAKQFGISQTHLKRIERGENWGRIKI